MAFAKNMKCSYNMIKGKQATRTWYKGSKRQKSVNSHKYLKNKNRCRSFSYITYHNITSLDTEPYLHVTNKKAV